MSTGTDDEVREVAETEKLDPLYGGDLQMQIAALKHRILELELALAEQEEEESATNPV